MDRKAFVPATSDDTKESREVFGRVLEVHSATTSPIIAMRAGDPSHPSRRRRSPRP